MTIKLGVLISGSGTNLQAIIDAIAEGSLDATIEVVISSRPSAKGLKRAAEAGIPTMALKGGLRQPRDRRRGHRLHTAPT